MKRAAVAIIDLGFGDAGKGAVTDGLARRLGAGLVVRFNGGAQAGHNVITPDGRHHTFSQFGAGHFAGARTLLGPDFLLHPLAMEVEAAALATKGPDPWGAVAVDARARLISPYQQAAGRIRERLRGAAAHGSCGVGIGECVADALDFPEEVLTAADLDDGRRLRQRLGRQRERKREELRARGATDLSLFEDAGLIDRVVAAWGAVAQRMRRLDPAAVEAEIATAPVVLFEGAQGVLLDQTWGFHPHTTWSDTTPAGARALLPGRELFTIGVLRAYACRHGAGPFPTEGSLTVPEPHNGDGGFQGRFRTGALDATLLRYALDCCPVDAIALTCLDRLPRPQVCAGYTGVGPAGLVSQGALIPGPPEDLGHRERLGAYLRTVQPVLIEEDPRVRVAAVSGLPLVMEGHGPRADQQRWQAALPTALAPS